MKYGFLVKHTFLTIRPGQCGGGFQHSKASASICGSPPGHHFIGWSRSFTIFEVRVYHQPTGTTISKTLATTSRFFSPANLLTALIPLLVDSDLVVIWRVFFWNGSLKAWTKKIVHEDPALIYLQRVYPRSLSVSDRPNGGLPPETSQLHEPRWPQPTYNTTQPYPPAI